MNADPSPLPPSEIEAAAGVRRLSDALLSHDVPLDLSDEVAATLSALAARVEACSARTKTQASGRYTGQQRIEYFLTNGSWPPPPPDGGELTFDALSFIGGRLSPLSAGVRYYRRGESAVGRVTFSSAYEGPPNRVHGGALAATFDEVMGTVFRVRANGLAFTGSLTVRFEAPAPIGQALEFKAWLAKTEGRKHTVQAEGHGPGGRFASATATFIEISAKDLAQLVEAGNTS
ncbi:MAG: PaaI family thioesterase [Actinomycetia bacterium]|nr:PaaI family thioesterase [Actinomycetes bacterium]MCP4226301.1 PaaI family thioesterase [Actinomycetes bacterium]MCP5035186.1 PaaI family thioesterase [Actinomycetes bacterium]